MKKSSNRVFSCGPIAWGYLVWGEFPNWGLDHKHPAALERFVTEWMDVLQRDFNHPSIITCVSV